MLYPHVGELTVSFNGGKDACVVARQGWSDGGFFSATKIWRISGETDG